MKNRYANKPEELEQAIKYMLIVKEEYKKITPASEPPNHYAQGYTEALEEILTEDPKNYATWIKADLDKLICTKSIAYKQKHINQDKTLYGSYGSCTGGYTQAYDDLYKLCYGNDFDVIIELDSAKSTLKINDWMYKTYSAAYDKKYLNIN